MLSSHDVAMEVRDAVIYTVCVFIIVTMTTEVDCQLRGILARVEKNNLAYVVLQAGGLVINPQSLFCPKLCLNEASENPSQTNQVDLLQRYRLPLLLSALFSSTMNRCPGKHKNVISYQRACRFRQTSEKTPNKNYSYIKL